MKVLTKVLGSVAAAVCSAALLAVTAPGVSFAQYPTVNNTFGYTQNSANTQNSVSQTRLMHSTAAAGSPVNAQTSISWAGFEAEGHTFNQVQGEITVPTVNCVDPNSNLLIWVGFDGWYPSPNTVEQVGIGADCPSAFSKPIYYAWWEMYPTNGIQHISKSVVDVKPGDVLRGTVTWHPSLQNYTMRIKNLRTNQTRAVNAKCGAHHICSRGSAEWIAEREIAVIGKPGHAPLASWSSEPMMFANARASYDSTYNLRPVSAFTRARISMYDNGRYMAKPSILSQSGTAFTVKYIPKPNK